ncbi:putative Tetratricopeptide repeat TPR repeat [Trypanosoma vivax]|uniref:Putative Bardet-Biedl syndrome 4 protein homolog (BBS4-like protein 4) n=1 Tax=Trypanosoma vivax (strain Y486) TaxID=1055687 RepID=G0U6X5_TRYVY|nr:putative Bardet-Biedl syndrome 4 protein [Trypanosoma vivax]KAH8611811.1 putative Tetratricopeptide repeat TPR repeat [Trypanosoma vivax]CCC51632.1 putative Bardet-Biedl syndrome 4 protein homolog (BBS4-like protein 4) [Trypanosoma vivax Y486]
MPPPLPLPPRPPSLAVETVEREEGCDSDAGANEVISSDQENNSPSKSPSCASPHGKGINDHENNPCSLVATRTSEAMINDVRDRRNWLIYVLYTRQEYTECCNIIKAQLMECGGLCEYALFVKGLLLRRSGDLTESLSLLRSALALNPHNPSHQKQVAQALLLLGRHDEAIEKFKQVERLRVTKGIGEDWTLQYGIGVCFEHMGDYRRAEDAFLKSATIQRLDCTLIQLGKVLVKRKDYARAIDMYEEALQSSPDNPEMLTALGVLYLHVGKPAKAFNFLGKCLTLNSSNPAAAMAAASVMQENGEYGVALNKYRVAIARLPSSARLWSNIGMCFFGQQNMHAAVACLRKATTLSPFEWRILYNLGLVFLHLKQYASAFHYLSAATHIHGEYAFAYMHIGICLALMSDVENADEAYRRALSIAEDPLIRLNYCIMLTQFGKEAEARGQLEHFTRSWKRNFEKSTKRQPDWGPVVPRALELLSAKLQVSLT